MKMTRPTPEQQALLNRLSAMPDSTIDYGDIPSRDAAWWVDKSNLYKPVKVQKTLRLDADVLAWFMGQGAGYQTRINNVLRAIMETEEKKKRESMPSQFDFTET